VLGVPVAGDYPYVHHDEGELQMVKRKGEVRMCIYRGNERDDEKNGGEGSKEKTRSESDWRRDARRKEGKRKRAMEDDGRAGADEDVYQLHEIHDIAVQMGEGMGELRGESVAGRDTRLGVGKWGVRLRAHHPLLEAGIPGRVEDRALPEMERTPEQGVDGRKAGSIQDDGQDERLQVRAHTPVYVGEDDDEGREAEGRRTPHMGEEREDEHEGDPAWRRFSRRTSPCTLRRKNETSAGDKKTRTRR
jgi:hypothetical protein